MQGLWRTKRALEHYEPSPRRMHHMGLFWKRKLRIELEASIFRSDGISERAALKSKRARMALRPHKSTAF